MWLASLALAAETHLTAQVAACAFPEGAQVMVEPELRVPLVDSRDPLVSSSHVAVLLHGEATPAFVRGGPALRFAPIAVWDATARVQSTHFFGILTAVLPAEGPDTVADRPWRRAARLAGEAEAANDLRVDLQTRLKARAGPVAAQLEWESRLHRMRLPSDAQWVWEPSEMLVEPVDGWVHLQNAMAFLLLVPGEGEADRRLWVGGWLHHGRVPASGDENLRVGPAGLWKPDPEPAWPTFAAGTQVWLESRMAPRLPPYTFVAATWTR